MAKARGITVARAAQYGHCSRGTIYRLLRAGKIKGAQNGSAKSHWCVTSGKTEIRQAVLSGAPKSGWTKNGSSKHQGAAIEVEANRVATLFELIQVPTEKREILIKLAKKFTTDELALLLEL